MFNTWKTNEPTSPTWSNPFTNEMDVNWYAPQVGAPVKEQLSISYLTDDLQLHVTALLSSTSVIAP